MGSLVVVEFDKFGNLITKIGQIITRVNVNFFLYYCSLKSLDVNVVSPSADAIHADLNVVIC